MEDLSLAVAQRLRKFAADNPKTDLALGFVPGVGQLYGAAQTAASLRDPEADALEKGMAAASMLPFGKVMGKVADKLRKMNLEKLEAERGKLLQEYVDTTMRNKIMKRTGDPREQELSDQLAAISQKIRSRDVSLEAPDVTRSNIIVGPKGMKKLGEENLVGDKWVGDHGRYAGEIDDSTSRLRDSLPKPRIDDEGEYQYLADVIDHPDFFKAYPHMEGARVRMKEGSFAGQFHPDSFGITLNPKYNVNAVDKRDTLLHEMQHAAQRSEDYDAPFVGASSSKNKFFDYMKDLGETEARVVQNRQDWTPEQRKSVPVMDHMDAEQRRLDFVRSIYKNSLEDKTLSPDIQRGLLSAARDALLSFHSDSLSDPAKMAAYLRRLPKTGVKQSFELVNPISKATKEIRTGEVPSYSGWGY